MSGNNPVAEHYNKIKGMEWQKRQASEIIAIREANNFLKQCLISKFVKKGQSVLDLGCGKGGDMSKLKFANINNYYGCDIAEDSLKEALSRSTSHAFKVSLMQADFTKDKILLNKKVEVVMAQFSLHYAFVDEISLKKTVANISNNLQSKGVFIMTVPDKNVITRRSERNKVDNSFGNKHYKITVSDTFHQNNIFGRGYKFFLNEAVTGCEEYLTDIDYLSGLLEKKGITKIFDMDFLSFLNSEIKENPNTFSRMVKSTITRDEIQVIELYRAVAYRKE